jgi:hypothetical protein
MPRLKGYEGGSSTMSDRRQFFKQAGALAAVPLARTPLAQGVTKGEEDPPPRAASEANGIVLENSDFRLVIGDDGRTRSLVHKATGQECLAQQAAVPMFTLTQYRPYDNELQLSYPAKVTSFPAQSVQRRGDELIVSFALVGYEATIGLTITDNYIGFTMRNLEYKGFTSLTQKQKTPVEETLFLQLPVRARKNLGDWLNVTWDDDVAVNLLATDPFAKIDITRCANHLLFQAGTVDEVKTEGVGAALITTATKNLLDRIAAVERDYSLPDGVESRRRKEYGYSYYELASATPQNIDGHIKFARIGGLRTMVMYYMSFAKTVGHFEWQPEYPNRMEDLKRVVSKISDAGMIPGIHLHYNKCHKEDVYVTPRPDPRLNLRQTFTLAEPLDATSTTITVEENPRLCTMDNERRILKIQNELVSYERYTPSPPYQFLDCKRGALNTTAGPHEEGSLLGLLDVDTWPVFVRFTQNTSIQQEVAERLGKIYREAGFKFTYFDGAEDVPPPFWFTVSWAQWQVWKQLEPKPLFSEGACKSHFSWHILTRGNAFDIFKPEVIKAATRAYPGAEAPRAAKDFTSLNFGWIGYWAPSKETIGTQPDMLEYITSRAAAWNCPIAFRPELDQLEAHPRTADNLEVIKRWEDVRASNWLTPAQKDELKNLEQEHILLINEAGGFELVPYSQVDKVGGSGQPARAFVFKRAEKVYVVYWHMSGEAYLALPLPAHRLRLMKELGKTIAIESFEGGVRLPLADRHYLECTGVSANEAAGAFQNARVLS